MVKKSELITETGPPEFFDYEYIEEHQKGVPAFLDFTIYTCDTDSQPKYAKKLEGGNLVPCDSKPLAP